MAYLVSLTHPGLQILDKTKTGDFSNFRVSCQSLIKESYHNFRASDDIDMKLGPVTKLDKRNKAALKIFDDDVMLENCDVIVSFPIYGHFRATQKQDSGRLVCKTYIFIKIIFYLTKTECRTKKSLTQLSHYCFE